MEAWASGPQKAGSGRWNYRYKCYSCGFVKTSCLALLFATDRLAVVSKKCWAPSQAKKLAKRRPDVES